MARHPAGRPRSTTSRASTASTSCTATGTFATIPSIVGGFALLHCRPVMVIGQQRGRDTQGEPEAATSACRRRKDIARRAGWRSLASRLGLPIVTFVDTKGADPGISSEEHAQSEAIATCLQTFTTARVPIVATIIGEGGSGGALALAIADRVIMLEHSTYSVASPEGCAAILWSRREQSGRSGGAVEVDCR